MKEVDFKIETIEVKAQTKKLRSKWSYDMLYDLNSFGGITDNLEKEIVKSLRREKRLKSIENIFTNQKP